MMDQKRSRNKASILFVSFLLLVALAPAQTADTFSLARCIDVAIQNNQNVRNKRLDELIQQAKVAETKADLYPQLELKGDYQYYPTVPTSLIEASAFGGPPGSYSATQLLVPQNINGSVEFAWQVYNPAIRAALKISEHSQNMSQTATKDQLEAVVYDVSVAFINIQINELQVALTRSNMANLNRNLGLTTQLYNQGLALKSDLDNLSLSIANLETILNNQLTGISQLYYLLKIYMGLPPDTPLRVEAYREQENTYATPTSIDTTSYKRRSDYVSLQQTGQLLMLQTNSIKAGYLPRVSLIGSFGQSSFNPELQLFKAYDSKWYATNLIRINVEVPLFEGFRKRHQLTQQKYQLAQNANSLQSLKNTFQMEQLNALNNHNQYLKDVAYQTRNVALATQLYNQRLLEYGNASASLNDMITVENTLKTAQSNYLNALIKLKLAALDISKANGELINY